MAVIDVFTYNGEKDMAEIHMGTLEPHVDKFIIIEAKTTFSGHEKPLYFSLHENHFKEFWNKIDYFIIDESYSEEEKQLAASSPNTKGAKHWQNEFLQKESIHKAIDGLSREDIVYIGDVDEIWQPFDPFNGPTKLKLRVYAYYLNNLSNEEFWGTLVSYYGDIKNEVLNHERSNPTFKTDEYHGWHFTSMGGYKEVKRKLNDSYTAESYNTSEVQKHLQNRLDNGIDYLGRDFKFTIDSKDWPRWLQRNILTYKHLCKTT